MKYLVVLMLVLGFACGSEVDSLTEFKPFVNKGLDLLQQYNPKYASTARSLFAVVEDNEGLDASLKTVTKVLGIKAIGDAIVAPIAAIASNILDIANQIMALVGLVILIIFLIDGGDVKSLVGDQGSGYGHRSGRSFETYYDMAADFVYNPKVEAAADTLFKALDKYGR